jgi:hypothetical protein
MPQGELKTRDLVLDGTIHVPRHVVHRDFPAETVVLNLNTGQYHGFNPVAGRMLEALEGNGSVKESADLLAEEFEQPREVIERDLCEFCVELLERDLIVVNDPG